MKKLLAIILVAVMALSVLPFAASADETFTWDEATATLTVHANVTGKLEWENDAATEDTFPWAEYRQQVKKVIFDDDVTEVGKQAFSRAAALEEVVVGKGCSTIGNDAFSYNGNLKKITFNAPITSFGQGVVWACSGIESVTITDQTFEQFKTVASAKPYNFANAEGKWGTSFDTATFTEVKSEEPFEPVLTITPQYGGMENWPGSANKGDEENVYQLLVGIVDRTGSIPAILRNADQVFTLKITGSNGFEKTIAVKPGSFYQQHLTRFETVLQDEANQFIPVAGVAYTVEVTATDSEGTVWTGKSADGAFACPEDFVPTVPAEYDYTQTPVDPPVDPIDPPQAGDATVMIAVLAVVALFGAAVVTKKVFVK